MLPRITPDFHLKENEIAYLSQLKEKGFAGDICSDFATRLSLAVDNSIYQVIPLAVLFPRQTEDIVLALKLAQESPFQNIKFCPRGGGTSTNGQSLSASVMIDCSRYMRNIVELNLEKKFVVVQPGVILDQLNVFLREYNYCFAPEISPSNRATIGGMVNTDACGIGSKLLGRTGDHIESLTCILASGEVIETEQVASPWYQEVLQLLTPHTQLIEEKFSNTPRTLCGYNLKKTFSHLNYLFAGSEGTLAIMSACKLKLTPIPKYKKLLVLKYRSFDDALRAVELTQHFQPLAVEAIDEKLIALARNDPLYFHLKDMIDAEHIQAGAINLIEFVDEDENNLNKIVKDFCAVIETNKNLPGHAYGYYIAKNSIEAKVLWELRKKSVGLISKKQQGTRRPIPFIEDTAVPPERLADYIAEFRAILDSYQLMYGMYGHVDAGCVHVRPALDMKLATDEKLIAELTEKIVSLIEKYQGVLWGEHGHGHRSVYGERFFGKTLFHVVRQIKTLFDPHNRLNPGKIAVPLESTDSLVKLTEPLRGQFDQQINTEAQKTFADSVTCNGNAACFNYATADVMCPSYKVTQNRVQSPKGRATVMREWIRRLSHDNFIFKLNRRSNIFLKWWYNLGRSADFSHEVFNAMSGCLGCKGCTSQCPLNVDVPDLKGKFLAIYYQRYLRPTRDYLLGFFEKLALLQSKFPRLTNTLLSKHWVQKFIRTRFKLVDTLLVSSTSVKKQLQARSAPAFNVKVLQALSQVQKDKAIILLQDTFSAFYEPETLLNIYDFLTKIGVTVYVAPFFMSGKPLQVKGFLRQFEHVVKKNNAWLKKIGALGISIIGIDPSVTLTYRDEYQKILGQTNYKVLLLQEWLRQHLDHIQDESERTNIFYLLSHCTEKTMCVEAEKDWQTIFAKFGLTLIPLAAGCCGMAGSYGHELEHLDNSKHLFEMDWQNYLKIYKNKILATGYSCRSQAGRFGNIKLRHPIEILNECTQQNG